MIAELKVMKGPNMWSREYPRLIVLKLKPLEQMLDPKDICGKVSRLFPEIKEELQQLSEKTIEPELILAELISRIAVYLQRISGASVSYLNTHLLGACSYFAVFEYEQTEHGKEATMAAINILEDLLRERTPALESTIKKLSLLYLTNDAGPSTNEILKEARRRGIPMNCVINGEYIVLGHGIHLRKIQAAISNITGMIAVDIAGNKEITKKLLNNAMLPVPLGMVISDEATLKTAIENLGFPLVTKPLNGHQGKCISTNITDKEMLTNGFRLAQTYSPEVIVEQFIQGNDYRFLVINYKFIAAARRIPAMVTGDGVSSIQELIEKVNNDPLRGDGHSCSLTKITVDEITTKLLSYKKLNLDSILPKGVDLILKDTANLSTGGIAIDVTDEVHPYNVRMAERIARIIDLDICGIDIMAPDVTTPFPENGGSIIEVNAAPGLRMHAAPSEGKPRPAGKAIIDMLFPGGSNGRIPIVAVTGTNGKTTTSRLMAHIFQEQGIVTGLTTTDGIYINGEEIVRGDCSGPRSSIVILQDPKVQAAVLECARGGILRSGLAFDQCDIAIVTNVAADHLGLKDIYTVEDMAKVKSVVPQAVKRDGFAILNAADELVYNMKEQLTCNIALFDLDGKNPKIIKHCKNGGIAAVQENDVIVIYDGQHKIEIASVKAIPITLLGKATFMTENVLPVTLAAYIMKFPIENIKKALHSFHPSEEQMPGRLNMSSIADRNIIVDYAHNPHGLKAFSGFMKNIKETKTGIITGVGDRRNEDIIEVGRLAAQMYDEVIIRVDEDTRDREPQEIISLVQEGVYQERPELSCKVIPKIKEALRYALDTTQPGNYIVVNVDSVSEALKMVKELKQEYEQV
jgi:cyanophycin synthetase